MLLFVLTNCNAQDSKNITKFKVNNVVTYGMSKAQVIQNLGTPTSTATEHWEMDNINVEVLYYGASTLTISDRGLVTYNLKDSSLFVQFENTVIRVGDSVNPLQTIFPQSWNRRFSIYNGPAIVVNLFSLVNGQTNPLSENIGITYQSSNNVISQIHHVIH